jgi:hypothetical protein
VKEHPATKGPRRRGGLHERSVDGEMVVLDPEAGQMHNLNETAAFIFSKIDGTLSEGEIAQALAEAFEVPLECAMADAKACIEKLRELKLVE